MAILIVRRFLGAAATFLAATALVFIAVFALPGDPARTIAGRRQVSAGTLQAIRRRYHLDESLPNQYLRWLGRLLHGDLGESYASRRPVRDILVEALPVTAKLLILAVVIEVAVGATLGALAGGRRNSRFDGLLLVTCVAALALPTFVVSVVAQDLFGVRWGVLPVAGVSSPLGYLLPASSLALAGFAVAARLMRSQTLAYRTEPYVITARSKGLGEGAITRRHIVRNAMLPFVAFLGLEVGALAAGSIVIERVFNLPGVGRIVARAISQRDNALIIGFTMAVIIVYLVADVVVDLISLALDPRLQSAA